MLRVKIITDDYSILPTSLPFEICVERKGWRKRKIASLQSQEIKKRLEFVDPGSCGYVEESDKKDICGVETANGTRDSLKDGAAPDRMAQEFWVH